MPIDIHQMDGYEDYSEESDLALEKFVDTLIDQFLESPEGKAHLEIFKEAGFWIRMLLDYGYRYEGLTPPTMSGEDVEDVLAEILPRKVTLSSREEVEDAIPELKAFWQYLKREYALKQSDEILESLDEIEPHFADLMFDNSRFGMAKSLVMAGSDSGFDMSDPDEMNKFFHQYNQQQLGEIRAEEGRPSASWNPFGSTGRPVNPKAVKAKKDKRKMAKASKKKNRKKKRK